MLGRQRGPRKRFWTNRRSTTLNAGEPLNRGNSSWSLEGLENSRTTKNDAASLLQRGQGVIDSVSTIGILSGLINDGKLNEARTMVESAELEHENKLKAAERKRLR